MEKFSAINERKIFITDPSIIKKYASFIIPFYITGEITCDTKLIDEYLEMNKTSQRVKSANLICDLEVLAVKQILDNPLTPRGYEQLRQDIEKGCIKLERFLKKKLQQKMGNQII
jgi:hypothetical protein